MPSCNQLSEEFAATADFLFVYVLEAHAQDEWPISSGRYAPDKKPIIINQPRTTDRRRELAKEFSEKFDVKFPMVVDPVENPFDDVYAAWPLRFYILQDGKLVHKAQPEDATYDISVLREWLLNHQASVVS